MVEKFDVKVHPFTMKYKNDKLINDYHRLDISGLDKIHRGGHLNFSISPKHCRDQRRKHLLILPLEIDYYGWNREKSNSDVGSEMIRIVKLMMLRMMMMALMMMMMMMTWERVEAASGRIRRTTLDLGRSIIFDGDKIEFNVEQIKTKLVLFSHLFCTSWVNMLTGTSLSRDGIPKSYART